MREAKVAINGLGRIGRAALKIILETPELELVAVNDIVPADNLAYLLNYDTVYGRYEKDVKAKSPDLVIDGDRYEVLGVEDPEQLPWDAYDVDIVFECTGVFRRAEDLKKHLKAGADHVILSAPPKDESIGTVVHGVNAPEEESPEMVSCASCTTNCIAPVVEVMERKVGIDKAIMTTVHAYTASQAIVDSPSKKIRRGRAGAANLVPTSTGAAIATTKTLPEHEGKFDGKAIRAPVTVGSIADIVFLTSREVSVGEVNDAFREESVTERYSGILGVAEDPLVSSDIIQDSRASVVDLGMTQVVDGNLVKVMSWYDNEWGFTNQMIREGVSIAESA